MFSLLRNLTKTAVNVTDVVLSPVEFAAKIAAEATEPLGDLAKEIRSGPTGEDSRRTEK